MRKLTLPYPDKSLSPNRKNGAHWAKTNAVKKSAFEAGLYCARLLYDMKVIHGEKIPVTITFYQSDKRKRDLDNLLAASKPTLDGVAQSLGIDDILFDPITIKRGYDKLCARMEIELG